MGKKKSTEKVAEKATNEIKNAETAVKTTTSSESSSTVVKSSKSGNVLQQDFEKLVAQFMRMDDPVARYMKREEMKRLQQELEKQGINVDVP